MPTVRVASFNVWGIDGKSVTASVSGSAQRIGPGHGDALAVGYQEVFRDHQLADIERVWLGAQTQTTRRGDVRIVRSRAPGQIACLSPVTAKVDAFGFRFDNSSGLALCVRGRLLDCFFQRFRGGYFPDRVASKGLLCAHVSCHGRSRAIIDTHFHNSDNDPHGGARAAQIEQLANAVRWIEQHWRSPIVLLGDFNIDSIAAYARTDRVARILYSNLTACARAPGAWWFDVNARVHALSPVPTVDDPAHPEAIDLCLLSDTAGCSAFAFGAHKYASDHLCTVSQWTEA